MKLIRLCGAGAPARKTLEANSTRARAHTILAAVMRSLAVLVEVFREIFDESAYERFLAQHQLTSSTAAYSTFCRERDLSRARRPRCC